ncbi:MAG TPA: helix-turn-helix domain-containing protein [Reyranella sp.]|nr:helix-turn-helix domain-containing protein [Reyranella sp.]
MSEASTAAAPQALDAFLRLIGERGYAGVTLADVAEAAGLGMAELHRLHRDKVALIVAFLERIDEEVLAGTPRTRDPEETARDRLFDVMMRRYDALRPYKSPLAELRRATMRDPILGLALAPALQRSMAATLEAAGIASDGLAGAVRCQALLAIHYAVSRVFDKDESGDLSQTMAALDGRLKTAERWSQTLDKFANSGWPRRPQRAEQAPEA